MRRKRVPLIVKLADVVRREVPPVYYGEAMRYALAYALSYLLVHFQVDEK